MGYRELIIELTRTHTAHAEALTDAFIEAGALSVTVEDADADTPDEAPLFGEPGLAPIHAAWQHSRIIVLIAATDDPAQLIATATDSLGLPTALPFATREVEEQDWVRLTQSQFEPISIGKRICVAPSWCNAPENALVIELDPGLAFGTGSHPTTRLCMEWLEQTVSENQAVLDYGCGSGILAILASKCGARPVYGVDIDSQAIEAARANSARNHADITYNLPNECPRSEFDIVVANILSNPLKLIAPMLCAKVKPGGQLALCGILARQADELIEAYAPWINLAIWREHEGWVCLAGIRQESL